LIANDTIPCIKDAEKYKDTFLSLNILFLKRAKYLFIYTVCHKKFASQIIMVFTDHN
jgi:hypothetical protein